MSNPKEHDRSAIDVIMAHRSVRTFRDKPIEDGLLELLVTAGTRASTSSNMQAYTAISITDREHKERIAALCGDQQQIHESAAFLAFCADLNKLTLACQMHGTNAEATGEGEALLIAVIDTALVMQNVAIAAESLGLGICMIGAMRNEPAEIADALRLPEHVIAISGLCVGWPADSGDVKPRLPLDATLHPEHYRSDDELRKLISQYDQTQSKWYADRDMHPRDPRWSSVMSRRLPGVAKRAAVGLFLRAQGFFIR